MKIPQGWEKYYSSESVLKLRRCIYGLKQDAMDFWCKLLKCMKHMKMKRSMADPCLYHRWTYDGLVLMASWIDDNLLVGSDEAVAKTKYKVMGLFDCEDCSKLEEYVGCKITRK